MIQATHIGLISHELESIYERVIRKQIEVTPQLVSIVRLVQDDVTDRIQIIRENNIDYAGRESIEILRNIQEIAQGKSVGVATIETVAVEADTSEVEVETFAVELETEQEPVVANVEHFESPEESIRLIAEETFLEEAEEILESTDEFLTKWIEQRSDRSLLLQLQRAAHSLKGGARMVENEPVAAISYQLETTFEQFAVHHFNSNAYDLLLQTTFSWLKQAIFERDYSNFDSLRLSLESIELVNVTAQLPNRVTQANSLSTPKIFEFIQGDGTEPPAMLGEWGSSSQQDNTNEMIRISADLVEKMIDLSGENAINRSRIEMDLGQIGNTLNEMELAMKRLADQLRRMEGELESQIIAKHGSENSRYADFDPLEMDQYSSLNQLSKSLAESASDLVDFKRTLADKIRDAEGLLLQQSRIQAEIQESLMRTRLVPFSRLLPRLQRIVRQTSSTLNRPTELIVNNTEGELDRTILERLVTPFEHMLRNTIDHGIEDTEQRQQAKKTAVGQIELNISRQGTDVLVSFSDDGKGIDEAKIQEKALNLGLIKADQFLDKQEILQLIFHPGFSTAKEVTQISGRGVGLDVVQSEIKALGGHVSVDSNLGEGTIFTIRVPTTVSVSDALMVKAGDQQFAISLAQIDRIVRIAPSTLEAYFNSKDDFFKIDNTNYKLRYLSEFVSNQPLPRLSNIAHSLPVLLIKGNNGQTIALLVDQLIGSRAQIVVKPIGQQFSSVGVVAGATILGNGQVCLILEGQNIARQIQATQRIKHISDSRDLSRHNNARRLIMIVDDSVTVRKVTSRLLERQGYDVVTAKDGVDAMEQLENVKPDLMLLDIEMPRMDGFEVTNLVRHHDVHQDLPIIMITSRTGEKHRERAFSLGVTHYMGKPFQEAELLSNVENLLEASQGATK
jgi:chemosensory pili system protein ChpA (sensor histidine kinase/response regulator)